MSYQSPGERRRAIQHQHKQEKETQQVAEAKSQQNVWELASNLLLKSHVRGDKVEVIHRLPKILGHIMPGDSIIRPGHLYPDYQNMPSKWRAARVNHMTEGWLLPKVARYSLPSDSRWGDTTLAGDLDGVLTLQGDIYTHFDEIKSFGGFAVYASNKNMLTINNLSPNPSLIARLEVLNSSYKDSP